MSEIFKQMKSLGVVPVVLIATPERAAGLGEALIQSGLPIVEVTFRTPQAEAAIKLFARRHPEILLGAGTVVSVNQAQTAVEAGAQFVVSPGLNPEIVEWCMRRRIPVIPGVATATEIQIALSMGCELMKYFPVELMGGPAALRAQAGPFAQARFMPSGGVGPENLESYLQLPNVECCAGSWLTPKAEIEAGEFGHIRERVSDAVEVVRRVRGEGMRRG